MIIISCTNRKNSISNQISILYQKKLKDHGIDAEIINLQDLPIDIIQSGLYENSGKNDKFNIIRSKVENSSKFIFVVPEYNGSFPGVLKVFIDALKYPDSFRYKKCALVGISSGVQGGALALSHLTDIFNYLGMSVLGLKTKLMFIEKHFSQGEINNTLYNELIQLQVEKFIEF